MKKLVTSSLALLLVGLWSGLGHAADHKDGPAATADPTADIADVYAWMSADATKVNLVMDVAPGAATDAKFSDKTLYVFHVSSSDKFGDTTPTEPKIICSFKADQTASCWVGTALVSGDASTALESADKKVKIFAGRRNDPFFFNLSGFKATLAFVKANAGGLTFNTAGCPALDSNTATAAAGALASDGAGGAGKDDFKGQNVLAIVIQLDKTLVLAKDDTVLGVWASTHVKK
jgi:hypothetical protein